jgi:hypothetical protein
MRNPVQRLKLIPWLDLLQVAGLTVLLATFLDSVLVHLYIQYKLAEDAFNLLLTPPLGDLMAVALAAAIGALAVFLMERCFQRLVINTANLWALVFCLAIAIALRALLPIPSLLLGSSQTSLLGLVVGVFVASWKYWRSSGYH